MSEMSQGTLFDSGELTPTESRSSAEDSPANLTALQENVRRLLTTVTCGANSNGSFAKLTPDGCWAKMYMGYCQVRTDNSLEEFSGTWPRWGTVLDGLATELSTLEQTTDEREYSLLPTPTVMDASMQTKGKAGAHGHHSIQLTHLANSGALLHEDPIAEQDRLRSLGMLSKAERKEMWATPNAADCRGTTGGGQGRSLRTDVKMRLSTPTASDAYGVRSQRFQKNTVPTTAEFVRMWPTPNAQDGKNSTLPPSQIDRDIVIGAVMRAGATGQLNPEFVEFLMNFPKGWTALD